jgi:IS30 family transposase
LKVKYRHLNLEERERLYGFWLRGFSLRAIARELGRSVSTVSREIGRHTRYGRSYLPCRAQVEAVRAGTRQRRRSALKNPLVFLYVREHLRSPYSWNPETIAGRLRIDFPSESLCHETIYRYVYLNPRTKREKLWQYLELHRKKRMKKEGRKVKAYTKLSEAIPIQERPDVVNKRAEAGHWETDNMEGKRSDKKAVSVTVERVTRKTRLAGLNGHTARVKTTAVVTDLKEEKTVFVKSITFDRGPENSGYKVIGSKLNVLTFACNPYHSWEKGTVENTIKRIRRYFPKGETLEKVTNEDLALVETILNSTPRKCLGGINNELVLSLV